MEVAARIEGLLIGQAVGDAIGLPREGLSPRRARRMFGSIPRHALFLGRGCLSDDTEHAFMTAQAILAARGDVKRFERSLAWRLRGWIAALPCGVGWATLRACLRLWIGLRGVRSAGNGPLMRATVIGGTVAERELRIELVRVSTQLTHTDPLALEAAQAVASAMAATMAGVTDRWMLIEIASTALADSRWRPVLHRLERALRLDVAPHEWLADEGLARGVSGFVLHTLPAVLFAWLRSPTDYEGTLTTVLELGGDTDTVGAIAGALCGASAGASSIPTALRGGITDWPITTRHLVAVARRLARAANGEHIAPEPMLARFAMPLRNLLVSMIVVAHIIRRLLPPY
jgi:ADP-ribosylglycohydrolase